MRLCPAAGRVSTRRASVWSRCARVFLYWATALIAAACSRVPEPAQFSGRTMGTSYHVTVAGADDDAARAQVQAVIDGVLHEAEQHLSTYNEQAEISRFNRSRTDDWQDVSPTLFAVAQEARAVSELTNGAFDITVTPLLELWDFSVSQPALAAAREPFDPPAIETIERVRRQTGYAQLELRRSPREAMRKTDPALQLTVDGIAPGYAVDRIATELRALGHDDFIVEIGGEVRAQGQRPAGGPWRIAVEVPQSLGQEPLAGIRLRDAAVSTSGDYRDQRTDRTGQRYSHTVDPRTGRPVQGRLTSVTVIDASAARADAYATALMVMGTEAGLAWARQQRVPALFVERTDAVGEWRIVESPAFKAWRE